MGQTKFFNFLKGIGYRVREKPLKYINNDIHNPKNNMDSYLTIDVMQEYVTWDILILFSGDSDFDQLLEIITFQGIPVHIFSFSNRMSYELKQRAFTSPLVSYTALDRMFNLLRARKY